MTQIKIDNDVYDDNFPIMRSSGADRSFVGWNGDVSVKSDFTKSDYNYFRDPLENKGRKGVLRLCQEAYDKVGIIKHVMDLMSDFGSKNIRIRHSDPKIDKFCKKWFKKVGGQDRSERFLNTFYRLGCVIVYETHGRAVNDITSKYIPIKYTFLNPSSIEVKDVHKGLIPSDFEYVIRYSDKTLRQFSPGNEASSIPEELKSYKDGIKPLPKNKLSVFNYKKDDWQLWGKPIVEALIDDLKILEKLKLSDVAALDGAISSVRLWTVGVITDNPQTTIIPTKPMLQKVRNIIANGVGGGSMDLIFGPEVSFKESATTVHQFLGEAKYKPTLDAIYDGLGIPSPLRSSNKDNNSSNTISLKTLTERLNYGRMYLIDFWLGQLKKVFEALGFNTDEDPIIEFDYMVLTDEAAEKKLILDMLDRDIIDIDTVHNIFKLSPELIKKNLKIETDQRGNKLPVKAGPFHNPHVEDEMKKGLLQAGQVKPNEIGLDIDVTPEEQEKRFKEQQKNLKNASTSKLGNSKFTQTPGRPRNLTETKKRQPKSSTKTSKASIIWAAGAQKTISEIYTPIALKIYNKKNVRSLSTLETNTLEEAKAKILFGLDLFEEINEETIFNAIGKNVDISELKTLWETTQEELGELTVEQKRQLTNLMYGEKNG